MQKIIPHLWFDKEAKEAAEFYTSIFEDSRIKNISTLHNTPSGDCDIVSFELAGQGFMAISAGPPPAGGFKFTPAVSFLVACETKEEVTAFWKALSEGGGVMMELGAYPFSEWYGWTADKYGLSWQIILVADGSKITQKITPTLLFVGGVCGKTEEAINFYASVFKGAPSDTKASAGTKIGDTMRYGAGEEPDKEGTIKYAAFTLEGQEFAAMDSAYEHKFTFNEAVSFIVHCDTQEEIDYFWEKLSAVPAAEQCGWLKDRYGLSWQIVPTTMDEMMTKGTLEQITRLTEAFLKMKKFDIAKLKEVYEI
jgi:predicted 3-demethylubiquinone-9 3-methyltransferase (glyoxalase superfamily)